MNQQHGTNYRLDDSERLALLAILRLRNNAYGMAIRREIEEGGGRITSIAGVYLTLERSEQKGFINSELGDATPERGGRAKRFYTINPSGREALDTSLRTLLKMAGGYLPILEA